MCATRVWDSVNTLDRQATLGDPKWVGTNGLSFGAILPLKILAGSPLENLEAKPPTRSSSRGTLSAVYFSRETLPTQKETLKGHLAGGPRQGYQPKNETTILTLTSLQGDSNL